MSIFSKNKQISFLAGVQCALFALMPTTLTAEEITLRSKEGGVNVVGELVDFVDHVYTLKTNLGTMRIPASTVECIGDTCPKKMEFTKSFGIVGPEVLTTGLLPLLLEGFAESSSAQIALDGDTGGSQYSANLIADEGFGDVIASYDVKTSLSSLGFVELLSENASIGMALRRITRDEALALRAVGSGNMASAEQEHLIALNSVVLITHPKVKISSVTIEQLGGLMSGQTTNWRELGGADMPVITSFYPPSPEATAVIMDQVFGSDVPPPPPPKDAKIFPTAKKTVEFVSNTVGAFSVVDLGFRRDANVVPIISKCGIQMTPDPFSVATQEYSLQMPMYLYNRSDNLDPITKAFIEFASSDHAATLASKAGYVGFGIQRRSQTTQDARALTLKQGSDDRYETAFMTEMLNTMVGYDRLSTTFRFGAGSSNLNKQGSEEMLRLIDYLQTQPEGTEVVLVGFTDDFGEFDGNRDVSKLRAQSLMQQLQRAGGQRLKNITLSFEGYGEIAPSSCNDTDAGRRMNRRVEVWIKNPI